MLLVVAVEAGRIWLTGNVVWRDSVAVVYIEGPIYDSLPVIRALRSLRQSSRVKGLLLRIDSPGGSVAASEEIHRAVLRFRTSTNRPVIVSMGNAAASGGYLVAVAGDEIYASEGTVTGSIGVIATGVVLVDLMRWLGIQPEVVKTGRFKDSGSPFRSWGEEDTDLLQQLTFDMFRQFFRSVLAARHVQISKAYSRHSPGDDALVSRLSVVTTGPKPQVQALSGQGIAEAVGATTAAHDLLADVADGRILSGRQAHLLGLIDHIGTFEDALERAGELAGLGKNPRVTERRPYASLPSFLGASARRLVDSATTERQYLELRAP